MKLTEEQKKVYMQQRGVKCPVCGSLNILAGTAEFDVGIAE